jgi:multicomponent Na+:H+ antiporter subunit A
MRLTLVVFSIFGLAALAPLLYRLAGRHTGWIAALLPLGLFAWFIGLARGVLADGPMAISMAWAPSLGLNLSFYVDGLSLLFAFLICGVGALVLIYTGPYMAKDPQPGRFYLCLLLFMGSMLGLVLADNALVLFVFWELTSVSSYLLIGFNHTRPAARAAALQALLVTAGGGLALLAGLVLLAQVAGTPLLSGWAARATAIQGHGHYAPMLLLVLLGAFTKSAQFPFHFWLPGAMEAPSPVSAYLHSATMVKAGVYLLARLHPALGGTELWILLLSSAGGVTMVLGAMLALRQTDLKRMLAFSTVSVLGLLVHLLGLGTELAISAAMVYLLAHALYKGALFLMAGVIDHETGTRDLEQVSGLRRAMPVTAAIGALAALSMAGLPPMFGFIGKEVLYEAVWGEETAVLVTGMAVLSSVLLVAVAGSAGIRPFVGPRPGAPPTPRDPPVAMWLGPALLAGGGLLAGLAPGFMDRWVLTPAIEAVLRRETALHLGLWHGFTPVLMLSAFTVACGIVLFAARETLVRGTAG